MGKSLTEGAGAAGYCAVRQGRFPTLAGRRVVVVLCGANIDTNILGRIIERSLLKQHRLLRLRITIRDRPGGLSALLDVVAEQGANVLHIHHDRVFTDTAFWQVEARLTLETRNREHIEELIAALRAAGYERMEELSTRLVPGPRQGKRISRSSAGYDIADRRVVTKPSPQALLAILRLRRAAEKLCRGCFVKGLSMHGREQVLIAREVEAIQIPEGTRIRLPEGMEVLITQELGGSFTIMTSRGLMYRIDQNDADALGKEVTKVEFDESVAETKEAVEERIWEQMKKCYDPEIPVNVVDLGLIYDCDVAASPNGGHSVEVKMTLTAPGCGMGPVLAEDVKNRVQEVPGVEQVHVEVVFDPPWNPNMMTEAARLQLGFM